MYGSLLLVGLLAYGQAPNILPTGVDEFYPGPIGRGGSALFTQMGGAAAVPVVVNSQNFTDDGFVYANQGADDFVVTGNGWVVDSVEVRGGYFSGAGPAESVNVYILGDAGGAPDTTNLSAGAVYAAENLSYLDVASGDFFITLPGDGVLLMPGTYWLVVRANMAIGAGGQWGWTEVSNAVDTGTFNGSKSHWFETSDFLSGGSCVGSWSPRLDTCGIGDDNGASTAWEFDLGFELGGTALAPSVLVSSTSLATSETGGSDSFDVVLTAPPVGGNTVTVPIGLPDASEGSVSATSFDFTEANWDIPQTATVTGVDDGVADGDVNYVLVNGPTVSGDGGYSGLNVDNVSVTNQDNESASVNVSPVSGLTFGENGGTASFDINLNVDPGGSDVTIPLTMGTAGVATLSVASVTLNSTAATTVTITGIDNDVAGGNVALTIVTGDPTSAGNAQYDALTAADVPDVSSTRVEDDTVGILVTEPGGGAIGTQNTSEAGSTDTFEVVLRSEPTADVTVGFSTSDASEGTVSPASHTFTSANWGTAVTVTLTGVNDAIDDGSVNYVVITSPADSSDAAYDNIDPADVSAINADDTDTAGITVSPTSVTTTENGADVMVTVTLDSEPLFNVSIPFTSGDTTEGVISSDNVSFGGSATLTFTPSTLSQTLYIRPVDDAVEADGSVVYTITGGDPSSDDIIYNAFTANAVDDITATNNDDEGPAGVTVTPGSITTYEDQGQAAATFTVVLDTEPTATVSIDVSSSNTAEGIADVSTLTFTTANWSTPQTVTVQGQQDFTIDGDVAYTIILDPATGGNYAGVDPDDVTATNINEDVCGPVELSCELGSNLVVYGTPTCLVDVYDTNESSNPADWDPLAAGVEINASGFVVVTDVTCEADTAYGVVINGSTVLLNTPRRTVPTLGEWGMIAFISLLAMAALVVMRRRQDA
jgi:hypothetical protein